jgi:transposase
MQVLSGEQTISPVEVPPVEIQELRGLFSTCRLLKKETTQTKNRIHALRKETLYGYTQEELFTQTQRKMIRGIEKGSMMSWQITLLFDLLEYTEAQVERLQDKIKEYAEPYMKEIQILRSMKGIRVFIAIAVITDIIRVERFRNSKAFTSYLRSAPKVANSNTSVNKGNEQEGEEAVFKPYNAVAQPCA